MSAKTFDVLNGPRALWIGFGAFFTYPKSVEGVPPTTDYDALALASISSVVPRTEGKSSWRPVRGMIVLFPDKTEAIVDIEPPGPLPTWIDHKIKPDGGISIERHLGNILASDLPRPNMIVVLAQAGMVTTDLRINIGDRVHISSKGGGYSVRSSTVRALKPLLAGLTFAEVSRLRQLANLIRSAEVGPVLDRLISNENCASDRMFEAISGAKSREPGSFLRERYETILDALPDATSEEVNASIER
jgi:hypothetical protein